MSRLKSYSPERRGLLRAGLGAFAGGAALAGPRGAFAQSSRPRELTMLAWTGHAEPDVVAAFEAANNVKIRVKYYTGGDNMLGLVAQSPPGTYDLILADAEYVRQLDEAGAIEPLDARDYPAFDDYFPEFQKFPGHWRDGRPYAVAIRFGFLGIAYNTQALTEREVSSYNVFWSPKLKGRVGHLDWHLPNLGELSLASGHANPFDLDASAWSAVQAWTMSLRPQVGGFFDFGGTFAALKNGQMLAMCGIGDYITGLLEKSGVPVRTVIPEEGGLQFTEGFCIGKGSRRTELARSFIQYITSPEGQVRSAMMAAYPALIPSRKGWELLNREHPEEAKRQRMVLGQANVMDDIRNGQIKLRTLPTNQSLETWNDFWSRYKAG